MKLYLDIETIGTDDAELVAEITATITPPKTMSKAETIAKWEAEEKPGLVLEAVRKSSFDGGAGRIVCIGWAVDNGPAECLCGADEAKLIADAFGAMLVTFVTDARVVGHNVGWDIRFLWQRCIVNKIEPPRWLKAAVKAKPWDIEDTMLLWNPERDRKISLDKLCKVLRVPSPKGELDGSKVWDYHKAGRHAEIAAYCQADVNATRECHLAMSL